MAPCFVSSTPLTARRASAGSAVCSTSKPATSARGKAKVSMMSSNSKETSLGEWLYRKFMHNALWEGDENTGYEPFYKAAMAARDEQKKKAYDEQEKGKK